VLPGHNRTRWIGDTLVIEARPGAALNTLAQRALQKRALTHFAERLNHFAPQLNLAPPALGLSSARTRWGSCSTLSGIRLNWRLIHLPPHLGDYVVVHELAHLHHMNHSKRFWSTVARVYPDWPSARDELRAVAKTLVIV
jgi:predicted metal-dependent hydrolase